MKGLWLWIDSSRAADLVGDRLAVDVMQWRGWCEHSLVRTFYTERY